MSNIRNVPAGAGVFVLAVFSGRANGYGAPVDLLRKVARVASRLAVRRRLAREFAGYLVSDAEVAA